MKAIHIEFAPDSMAKRLHYTAPSTVMLSIVVLVICAGSFWRGNQLFQGHVQLSEKVQDLQADIQKIEKKQVKAPVVKLPQDQVIAINQAVTKLNLPWSDVFDALEKASSDRVALLQVSPNSQKASLKVMAETKSSDDMIAYLEGVKQQKFFTDIVLEKHEINEQDPNKPYRFQFEVQWRNGARQ